MVLHLFAD